VAEEVRGRKVLEVAAGTGLFTVELARTAAQVVATDRSPAMLDVLRGRVAASGFTNVEVRAADATAIEAEAVSFDAVVAANLLHLLPQPERMLAEARRVLRPGGLLAAPTFAHGYTRLARMISRLLAATGFPIVSRLRAGDLARLVGENGFTVTR